MKILIVEGEEEKLQRVMDAVNGLGKGIFMKGFEDGEAVIRHFSMGNRKNGSRVRIVTFGNFNVFADGKPVEFRYSKAMELFAVLVDRRGKPADTEMIRELLWQDSEPGKNHSSYLSLLKKDMTESFLKHGIADIFFQDENGLALITDKVDCDFYDYLDGAEGTADFDGIYMEQYSWAEPTTGELTSIAQMRKEKSGLIL